MPLASANFYRAPDMPLDKYRETNLTQWEERAAHHWKSESYGVQEYAADPDRISRIIRFDAPYLGDIKGKKLVHLQCHIGTDTISLARLGAEVTGVDFSPSAIERAREFAELCKTPATFVQSELYDTPNHLPADSFDIVYTSTGVLGWLPPRASISFRVISGGWTDDWVVHVFGAGECTVTWDLVDGVTFTGTACLP